MQVTECLAQNKLKYALLTHRFGALYYKSGGTDIHMKNIAASFLLGVFLTAPLQAATLSRNSGPSELPPASFSGDQFVDSKGCVYLRAGHSGAFEWVPRVTRDRKLVCGFQPSFAKTQAQQIVKSAPRTVASKPVAQGKKPIPTVASTVATQPVRTKPIVVAPQNYRAKASANSICSSRAKNDTSNDTSGAPCQPRGQSASWISQGLDG
jgi:hypothetical protein